MIHNDTFTIRFVLNASIQQFTIVDFCFSLLTFVLLKKEDFLILQQIRPLKYLWAKETNKCDLVSCIRPCFLKNNPVTIHYNIIDFHINKYFHSLKRGLSFLNYKIFKTTPFD